MARSAFPRLFLFIVHTSGNVASGQLRQPGISPFFGAPPGVFRPRASMRLGLATAPTAHTAAARPPRRAPLRLARRELPELRPCASPAASCPSSHAEPCRNARASRFFGHGRGHAHPHPHPHRKPDRPSMAMGRPKVPKKLAKTSLLSVRFSESERKALEKAAQREGITLSEWARRTL